MRGTPEQRAEFRAFARRTHPDRGGDPAEFAAGVAGFRTPPDPCDGPVSAVHRPRGLPAVALRLRRWHDRRFRKPRVR